MAWAILFVATLLLLNACASKVKLVPDLDKAKPKLVLNPGEFRVVRTVSGRASCPYFLYINIPPAFLVLLGINDSTPPVGFALGDASLHVRAMENLHSKHEMLGRPQILHQFVEESTVANYLGLFAIERLSITAEVIEFIERSP
jgi:hypothetical protein